MSRSTPFHKQTDPNKQAGQVVYKVTIIDNAHPEGISYEDWATPPQPIKVEHTLHHYIERKTEGPTRITFVEWAKQHNVNGLPLSLHGLSDNEWQFMETIWNTALTKGKL